MVFSKGSTVAPGVEGTPRIRKLKEAVLHQVWGVYANVVHHVDVLNGLVLSLDEGGTAGTCLNGTLFRGLRAGEGKKRKGYGHVKPNLTAVAFLGWPPKAKELFWQDPLHSNLGYPVGQDSTTKPGSSSSPITLQWATWKTKVRRSSPHFSFPSLLLNLSSKLLRSWDNVYFPNSILLEEKISNAWSKGTGKEKQRDGIRGKQTTARPVPCSPWNLLNVQTVFSGCHPTGLECPPSPPLEGPGEGSYLLE